MSYTECVAAGLEVLGNLAELFLKVLAVPFALLGFLVKKTGLLK